MKCADVTMTRGISNDCNQLLMYRRLRTLETDNDFRSDYFYSCVASGGSLIYNSIWLRVFESLIFSQRLVRFLEDKIMLFTML